MKKFLILPVLFLALFLSGCNSFYSQDQVSKLIQQESAARQAEINALKQQANDLQSKVNDLTQKANTPAVQSLPAAVNSQTPVQSLPAAVNSQTPVQSLPAAVNSQTPVPAAVNSAPSSIIANDSATKDWLTFVNKNLNYQFKYPKDFFWWQPKFEIFDCDANKFAKECPYYDKTYDGYQMSDYASKVKYDGLRIERRIINGHEFCIESQGEGAAGSLYTTYYYINVKDNKCGVMMFVKKTSNGCGMYDPGLETEKCENYINIEVPQTISKIESTFSFK